MNRKLVLLVVLASCSVAKAQDEKPAAEQQPATETTQTAPAYTTEKFNAGAVRLPVDYKGQDPIEVYNGLVKKLGPKTEFETTEAYNKRRADSMQTPLIGSLTPNDTFATQVDVRKGNSRINYDADKGIMRVEVISCEDFVDLPLSESEKILGTYTGQNAYGVEREITEIQRDLVSLVFTNYKAFGIKKDICTNMKFDLPMPVDKAIATKPNLKMLVVYNLQAPFVSSQSTTSTPKVDNPYKYHINRFYISAIVRELWFYNSETGEVITKLRPRR